MTFREYCQQNIASDAIISKITQEPGFPPVHTKSVGVQQSNGLTRLEYFTAVAMQAVMNAEAMSGLANLSNPELTADKAMSYAYIQLKILFKER